MKHVCRTCGGTKILDDGKPCPDCMLEVIKTIKNCMDCKWSSGAYGEGNYCAFHVAEIKEDTQICNFYKTKNLQK